MKTKERLPKHIRQTTIHQPPLKPIFPPRYESSPKHVYLDGIYRGERIPTKNIEALRNVEIGI